MATWLKQSTSVDLPIGPFLDATDAVTAETGLTLTQPDIRLKKNGGAWAQKAAAQTLSHEENGWYELTLDATDTDTLGQLKLAVHESGALPVWHDFMVVPANVWDSFFGSDKLQVDAVELSGDSAAADNAESFFDGTGYAGTGNTIPTVTAVTTVNGLAANTITATSIATGAITAAKFAAGAIDAAAIATDAITANKVADGTIDALTFAAGAINAAAIATDAITANKIADGAIDALTFAAGAITAGAIATDAIDADAIAADAIGASQLAASAISEISGAIDPLIPTAVQNADAVWDEAQSLHVQAGSFGEMLQAIRSNTAQAGGASTITLDAGASAVDDNYNFQRLQIVSGTGAGQSRFISDYVGSTRVATLNTAWAVVPDATSDFVIHGFGSIPGAVAPSAADIRTEIDNNSTQLAAIVGDTNDIQSRLPAALVSGRIDASVGAMAANVMTAAAAAADLTTELQAGLATASAVATLQVDTDDLQTRLPAALVGGRMDANVGAISADSVAADNAEAFFDGTGYAGTNNVIPTVTAVTTVNGLAANTLTAAAAAADLTTELQAGLATAAALATLQTDTDDIQARLPAALVSGRIDASVGAMAAGTVTATAIATAAIDADAISGDAALEIAGAVWDEARSGHVASGSFGQALQLVRNGTAQAGGGASITLDAGASGVTDFYVNSLVQIIGGTGIGQARFVTAYDGTTKVATVSIAWGTAPDSTSVFILVPFDAIPGASAPSAATVAAAVWDEARSGHTTSGTFGQGAASVQGNVTGSVASVTGNVGGNVVGSTASVTGNVGGNVTGSVGSVAPGGITAASLAADAGAEIADSVWDEPRSGHVASGSFGQFAQLVRDGTAQAGASTTITLDAGASSINDFYNDTLIAIIGGTGAGQCRFISDYVGTSKVATVSAVWSTAPDSTSVFIISCFGAIPGATAPTAGQVADAVWDEVRADHTTAGTFGHGVASVQGNVAGSVTSVTGNVTGNVSGSVGSLATQAKADVNAEVVDVLTVDIIAELAQGQPPTTPTFGQAVMLPYMALRNESTQNTSGLNEFKNNAGTVIAKRTSTDDGTILTRPKLVSGP